MKCGGGVGVLMVVCFCRFRLLLVCKCERIFVKDELNWPFLDGAPLRGLKLSSLIFFSQFFD